MKYSALKYFTTGNIKIHTALHVASYYGNDSVVRTLIENGADVTVLY